jgi:glutaredoxin-like protein NrdH
MIHKKGKNKGQVTLYALSTCAWCKKTRELLDELQVKYDYVYVDNLSGQERGETIEEIKLWNPRCSFPTLVINNQCIVGFEEQKIREALA